MLSSASVPVGVSTKIIAIDGCGGAGKSTLAAQISAALGSCPVIHTDDFASWDNPLGWYDRMIDQVLKPLKQIKLQSFRDMIGLQENLIIGQKFNLRNLLLSKV